MSEYGYRLGESENLSNLTLAQWFFLIFLPTEQKKKYEENQKGAGRSSDPGTLKAEARRKIKEKYG